MRVVLGITGASGAAYGLEILEQLHRHSVETHLIVSKWARETIAGETGRTYDQLLSRAFRHYGPGEMTAGPASGSFLHSGMVIAPCSMKTLASIAAGFADNLITRAADVTIKERRPLILLVRETPLSPIHLENMLKLARLGVVIMPPVPALYTRPATLDDIIRHTAGRVLDCLGIENQLVPRWGE
ncbi:MAG: UbiX family flavin prenyltransferase [Bacillota bacterium]